MIRINGQQLQAGFFPDGTPRLHLDIESRDVLVEWLYEPNEEMLLFYAVRHLREQLDAGRVELYMPYIPNARMDRVKSRAEVFTLKYFCDFINRLGFDRVTVRDAHSSVSPALLERVVQEDVVSLLQRLAERLLGEGDIVFYPDEGSCKRYSDLLKLSYAFGVKSRDWETGKIQGLDLMGDVPKSPFNALIIDDISSYGGTFLHGARRLKEAGAQRIYLYVTHCENSILDGELINSGLVEKIYTTRSIYTGTHPDIEVIGGDGYDQY